VREIPRAGDFDLAAARRAFSAVYDRAMRRAAGGLLVIAACASTPKAQPQQTQSAVLSTWQPLSYGTYLAPEALERSPIDAIFHFHAGRAAEEDYRAANLYAVVVSITLQGLGTTPYWEAMNDPEKFAAMRAELAHALTTRSGHDIAIGRIALVSWSAGYASTQRIVALDRYYSDIDTLILLDGPHTGYVGNSKRANIQTIAPFVRMMHDARDGKKLFVMTHSSIVPEGYASTTEVADALAIDLGAAWTAEPRPGPPGAMRAADAGDAHLRGFPGRMARDHVVQVHFVRDVLQTWLAPRWK